MNDEIIGIEERLAQAWVARDRAFIESVLAPEWTVTDPSGRLLTRQQVLDETFGSDERQIDSMTVDQIVVREFGDIVVATGRTRATGSYRGERATVQLRFTDVLRKQDQRWQFVVSHGTLVAE